MNDFFEQYWELLIAIIISALILYAQITYWILLYRKKVKPAYLSWFGWAILMGISFAGQFLAQGWSIKIIALLLSTTGCIIIGISARFIFKQYSYEKKGMKFLYIGLACGLVYLLVKDEWLTTIIAILADLIVAIPTFKNASRNPMDEKSGTWIFTLPAWGLTLVLVLNNFMWLHMLWPLYLIAFNGLMIFLVYIKPQLQNTNRNIAKCRV